MSDDNEETVDQSKFMLSDQLETEAKTQLSNQDTSPKIMNINSSRFCDLTSRKSGNVANAILLTESGKEQESAEKNAHSSEIPLPREKFEIDILSQIAQRINQKEDHAQK